MHAEEIARYIARHLPGFIASGSPQALTGGHLNFVWRVPGAPSSVVVKIAPPYVATAPELPLSADRILFEAGALALFGKGGALNDLAKRTVGVPRLIHADRERHLLVIEDLGDGPDMGAAHPDRALRELVAALGEFVGRLHTATRGDSRLATRFNNRLIQESRNGVQYQQVSALLRQAGVSAADMLGKRAAELGRRLLLPGRCLVMGDLWPRSILIRNPRLYLIDWEFVHFGSPAQDVGHLTAHLWMLMHRSGAGSERRAWSAISAAFLERYMKAAATAPGLVDESVAEDAATHFGCELLARTVGPFQAGYLYDGLTRRSVPVCEAVAEAVRHLADPRNSDLFGALIRSC